MRFKLTAIAAAAFSLATAHSAAAAPPMVPAVYDWSGIYAGVNAGWGKSRSCWDYTLFPFNLSEGCHDAAGGVFGGQIGFRFQYNAIVFGVEAQGDWADIRGSNVSDFIPIFTNQSRVNNFGMLTGQIGYAFNNLLIYAKGGFAATRTSYNVVTTIGGVPAGLTPDQTRHGSVLGGGVEYGFAPNWSIAVEYAHLFMPDKVSDFADASGLPFPFGQDRISQDVDLVTFRLNFHWPVH
jgi:outer membrane immunogenic protein